MECREINQRTKDRASFHQEAFDRKVKQVFNDCCADTRSGAQIWQDLLTEARDLSQKGLCNVYSPNRKQLIRCVREIRKQAADHRNIRFGEVK